MSGKQSVQKPRRVAVIEQRKSDGAVTVAKIFKLKGKENKIGKTFIPGVILKPESHTSFTENSVVGRETIMGVKQSNGSFKAIYTSDLTSTNDRLTRKELKKVRRGVHNDQCKHRKAYKRKLRKWKKSFK